MKVYIIVESDYDSSDIVGVYRERAEAERRLDQSPGLVKRLPDGGTAWWERSDGRGPSFSIEVHEVR